MSTLLVNNIKSYTGDTVTISGSNISVTGNTTLGDSVGIDNLVINGNVTASSDISASGIITAEHFLSSDDAVITDDLTVGGDVTGSLTTTASFGQLELDSENFHIHNSVSLLGKTVLVSGSIASTSSFGTYIGNGSQITDIAFANVGNTSVTAQSGTGAEDLTGSSSDLIWYASTTQAGDITLPQATANNVGMKIKIIAAASWATSPFKLGFTSGGSTVMTGRITVSALDAVLTTTFPVTSNAKNLVIDADAVATAGGAIGSVYEFTYLTSNLVLCEANAFITTGTVATTAAASVTGGI